MAETNLKKKAQFVYRLFWRFAYLLVSWTWLVQVHMKQSHMTHTLRRFQKKDGNALKEDLKRRYKICD